jgi:ATP-dependent metalloprotease FtsH
MAGPPGTGKTMLARAVAGESQCAFIETSASSFVTVWQGSGPQNVRDLFMRARRYAPAVVFIDEIDAIGIKRGGAGGSGRAQEETLNALLTEMDGFSADSLAPVIVLAATNLADQLDEALKRRFDRTVEVERPDRAARQEYLRRSAMERKTSQISQKTIERLAGQTAGLTIADLERIVHEAAVMAAQNGSALTDLQLEEAFEKFRMGEARPGIDQLELERVARHEAGHTMIACYHGNVPVQVTIVGRGGAGGFMEREQDEDKILSTKPEMQRRICESMGGRAAELVYYGNKEGLSTGVAGDLRHATAMAFDMVTKFGMAEEVGLVALPELFNYQRFLDGPLAEKIKDATHRIVKEQLDYAVGILQANRDSLDRLSAELLEKNRLTGDELLDILPTPDHMQAPDSN